MIWADRVALAWAALVSLFFFLLNGMAAIEGLLSYPYAMFVFFGISCCGCSIYVSPAAFALLQSLSARGRPI
jgi:hypothetical protein